MGTGDRKIDVGTIGQKTQTDRHGEHWAQDKERYTRVTLGTRQRKIDTSKIGYKTQKDRQGNIGHKIQKDRHG